MLTIDDIKNAAKRIHPYIHRTPVFTSSSLDQITQTKLFFKCEIFQKMGAFKFRGACNAVFALSEKEALHGVATHSSGNHGAALALAAKTRGIKAYIVMPKDSTQVKKDAVASYGAEIIFCEPTQEARETTLKTIIDKTGAIAIHPFDNEQIIAGQGTVALEFLEQCNELDMIVVPIGGGGLIAGIAIATKASSSHTQVIGAEPELINDAYLSFKKKEFVPSSPTNERTICDGLRMNVGKITLSIILDKVDDIYTAREKSILMATKYIWERMKLVVEPSGAIPLAIVLEHADFFRSKKIGLVLSGGNVDIKAIANLM